MMPTADDVARAIVAACRETDEDPIRCASGLIGHGRTILRGRHYALHALLHVFRDLSRLAAARMVGAPGKPASFYHSSWNQIVRQRASGGGHVANWFDDEALGRVIEAIEKPLRKAPAPVAKVAKTKAESAPKLSGAVKPSVVIPRTGLDQFYQRSGPPAWEAGGEDQLNRRASEKKNLQEMLAEAARNTAKLQQRQDDDKSST